MTHSQSRLREVAGSSVKAGVATVAGLLGWLVGGKVLALELGAAGVGVFGLLRQLLQNLSVFSTFNGSNALVQGLASRVGERQDRYSRTVARLYFVGGLGVAAVLVLGSPWLGPLLIPHPQGPALLRWLALAVLATNAQAYFSGLLTGHRALNALVRSQLFGPAAVILLVFPVARLVRAGQPAGLVLMLAVPGAVVGLTAMMSARAAGWFRWRGWRGFDSSDAGSFFQTSAVLMVSGLLVTGAQYIQNRLVVEQLGLEQSGHFWVAWTLSMTYVSVLLGSYGTYYMPVLSSLTEPSARRALIRDYLRLASLVMPVLVALVILLKPWIVIILFSSKLLPALKVMRWMLIGDFLKGISWVLAFPMLAFNEMRWFFWTELVFNSSLVVAAWACLSVGAGIEGLGLLFLVLYLTYLPVMAAYVRLRHQFRIQRAEVWSFLAGLGLVLGVSAATWNDVAVRPAGSLVFLALCGIFLALSRGSIRELVRGRADVVPRARDDGLVGGGP